VGVSVGCCIKPGLFFSFLLLLSARTTVPVHTDTTYTRASLTLLALDTYVRLRSYILAALVISRQRTATAYVLHSTGNVWLLRPHADEIFVGSIHSLPLFFFSLLVRRESCHQRLTRGCGVRKKTTTHQHTHTHTHKDTVAGL
jgi:hypothetical protein